MIRPVRTLSFVYLFCLLTTHSGAQICAKVDLHIRSDTPQLLAALSHGVKASATLREIVGRLERSDVVVQIDDLAQRQATVAPPRVHMKVAEEIGFVSWHGQVLT